MNHRSGDSVCCVSMNESTSYCDDVSRDDVNDLSMESVRVDGETLPRAPVSMV